MFTLPSLRWRQAHDEASPCWQRYVPQRPSFPRSGCTFVSVRNQLLASRIMSFDKTGEEADERLPFVSVGRAL